MALSVELCKVLAGGDGTILPSGGFSLGAVPRSPPHRAEGQAQGDRALLEAQEQTIKVSQEGHRGAESDLMANLTVLSLAG